MFLYYSLVFIFVVTVKLLSLNGHFIGTYLLSHTPHLGTKKPAYTIEHEPNVNGVDNNPIRIKKVGRVLVLWVIFFSTHRLFVSTEIIAKDC